jgi:predicted amidohydrolase YtcJ
MRLGRRSLLGAGLGAIAAPAAARALDVRPELVLHGGRIWTGVDGLPEAQAVAIADGRVLAIGSDADVLNGANAATKRVDLGGRRVTPGFYDAHAHPVESGVQLITQVACDSDSIDAIKAALRKRADATPAGEPVIGFLYDDGKTPRPLDRADLDEAAPGHPVIVAHRGGHTAFVNSLALKAAGVDETTPDPPGGHFFRDANGRLNGRVGDGALAAFEKLQGKPPTREDYAKAAALISKMFTAKGVTSSVDAAGSPDGLQGYVDARDAGELRMRISCNIFVDFTPKLMAAGIKTGFGDDWVRIGAQKQFADGSISERTAWLSKPYLDMPGNFTGLQTTPRDVLYEKARAAHVAGWQLGVHANGDLAIDETLGVFEQLQREHPRRDPRFRIEHCTMVNDALVARMKAVGAVPIPFAGYVYFHGDVMHFYGHERTEHMFAMRSLIDAGLRPPSSSDYTASPSEPMMWMQSQITRTDFHHEVWGPSQRITPVEALRCGTINGAWSTFDENDRGTLEPGKHADLVAWSRDPLTSDPASLIEIKAERVMTGGRWVHEA